MSGRKRKCDDDDASRLVALHRGPYLSQSALTSILRDVRDHGLPAITSRTSQLRAHEKLCHVITPYGPAVQELQIPMDPPVPVTVQSPMAMLYACVRRSPPFRELLRKALERHPCSMSSMWNLAFYWDGISPNNPLAKGRDKRAVDAVYWSFLELEALWMEDLWFCCSATRHCIIT